MNHCVDTRSCRDVCGQTQGQFWIENRPVRQQPRRYDALLFGGWRRNDGDRGHLRACSGGRRHQQQRKAFPLSEAHAVNVIEPIGGFGEVSHEFRGIEGAASADRSNKANSLVPAKPDCPLDHMGRRIRLHVFKHGELAAAINESFFSVSLNE
jgi:hypothetical protein